MCSFYSCVLFRIIHNTDYLFLQKFVKILCSWTIHLLLRLSLISEDEQKGVVASSSRKALVMRQPSSTLPQAQQDCARITWKADDGHSNIQVMNSRFEGSSEILFSSHYLFR